MLSQGSEQIPGGLWRARALNLCATRSQVAGEPSVTCWGERTPLREFLYDDDLGEACVYALESWQPADGELQYLNVGKVLDLSIKQLAEAVAGATGL